jgi:hypothetical protein
VLHHEEHEGLPWPTQSDTGLGGANSPPNGLDGLSRPTAGSAELPILPAQMPTQGGKHELHRAVTTTPTRAQGGAQW